MLDVGLYLSGCRPLEERTVTQCCRMLNVGLYLSGCRPLEDRTVTQYCRMLNVGLYLSGCRPLEERTVRQCCRMLNVGLYLEWNVSPWRRGRSHNVAGCWMSGCTWVGEKTVRFTKCKIVLADEAGWALVTKMSHMRCETRCHKYHRRALGLLHSKFCHILGSLCCHLPFHRFLHLERCLDQIRNVQALEGGHRFMRQSFWYVYALENSCSFFSCYKLVIVGR